MKKSAFKRKTKAAATPQEEKDAIRTSKEELMAMEIINEVTNEAKAATAAADALEEEEERQKEELRDAHVKEAAAQAAVDMKEKVVDHIEADLWTVERVFAAFDKVSLNREGEDKEKT